MKSEEQFDLYNKNEDRREATEAKGNNSTEEISKPKFRLFIEGNTPTGGDFSDNWGAYNSKEEAEEVAEKIMKERYETRGDVFEMLHPNIEEMIDSLDSPKLSKIENKEGNKYKLIIFGNLKPSGEEFKDDRGFFNSEEEAKKYGKEIIQREYLTNPNVNEVLDVIVEKIENKKETKDENN